MGRFERSNSSIEQRARWHPLSGLGSFLGFSDIVSGSRERPEPRTIEEVVRLPVVFGCVRVRADRLASMEIQTPDASKPNWLFTPDPTQDSSEIELSIRDFLYQCSVSLDLAGNAFIGVVRGVNGEVQRIYCLDPNFVGYDYNRKNGRWSISVNGYAGSEVVVIPNFILPNYPLGLSPIELVRLLFSISKGGELQALNHFRNSSIVPGVISSDSDLTEEQVSLLQTTWRKRHGGTNRGYLPAYIGRAKWNQIGVSPEQAQFLQSRQYSDTQIASQIFGVDPTLVGLPAAGRSLQYSTLERRETSLMVEMQSSILRLQDAFSKLAQTEVRLVPRDWADPMTKAKTLESYGRYTQATGQILLTTNEARELIGKEPLSEQELSELGTASPVGEQQDSSFVTEEQVLELISSLTSDIMEE